MTKLLNRSAVSALALSLVALAGCDLLFGPPPQVIDNGGGRGRSEGEGDVATEGEGDVVAEGEGEPNVPPDVPPDPQGPRIQSIAISSNTLTDSETATLTVVVTDPDGVEDIVGPLLIEPISSTTLGTLTSSGAGTFTATVSWNTWSSVDPVEFSGAAGDVRFVRVQFSDVAGHRVTSTERIQVVCDGGLPACDGRCGAVRCAGQDNTCLDTEGSPISADGLCGICGQGCSSCASGCTCFNESPSCTGGADCLFTINNEGQGATQCAANAGLTLRPDGFMSWKVANLDSAVLFGRFSTPSGASQDDFGNALCAPFGGLSFTTIEALPSDLRSLKTVLTVEEGCVASSPATCEPVLGLSNVVNTSFDGTKIVCNNPIVVGEGGAFGEACNGGTCAGDMFCDSFNTCQESCSIDDDCGSCAFDNPAGCHCNVSSSLCEVGAAVAAGAFGQACIGGNFGSCNNPELFCNSSTGLCDESCSSAFDCEVCNADTGTSCTCDTNFNFTCLAGGGGGGGTDFSCVTSNTRKLTTTGSFSGSTTSGASLSSATCGGDGPEQFWQFTPPTTRTYTISSTGFDTILYVKSECGSLSSEVTCDDDGQGTTGSGSRKSVSLTGGVPVLIVVDGFSSSTFGSYTLGIE